MSNPYWGFILHFFNSLAILIIVPGGEIGNITEIVGSK
jgi:hypothetical protein